MPFLNPIYIIALLIAVSVHEWAHAVTATKLGDPTPGDAGRLSLSPLAHLDLLGVLLFLTVGFGWAKPVPINPMYFHRPKRDTFITAAAGPVSNLILATIAFVILTIVGQHVGGSVWSLLDASAGSTVGQRFFVQLCSFLLFANLGLMAFNLLPIAPLDGSKVVEAFIPLRYADQYDEFMRVGPYILLALFIAERLLNIPVLSLPISWVMEHVLMGLQFLVMPFVN